jgi:hypothetical protein
MLERAQDDVNSAMTKPTETSTGTMALQAFEHDSELRWMMREVRRLYGRGPELQTAIESKPRTSSLTAEYGSNRPSGLDLFKLELTSLSRANKA